MLEQGKSERSLCPEEEGVAETTCDELTVTRNPHSLSPCAAQGEESRNVSEVERGKKGGVGGRCFEIWFHFSLSYCDFIGNELNFFFSASSVCFVHDANW